MAASERRARRGFTLTEMMVGVAIGSATVVLAAQLGTAILRGNFNREQASDALTRTRVLNEQIRADIQLAGMGSTGAIGVDPSDPVFLQMQILSAGGIPSIPAITGANTIGGLGLPPEAPEVASDALQLVVPNPRTTTRTTVRAPRGGNVLTFLDTTALVGVCNLVFIHDHTSANGAGRTQVAWVLPGGIGANTVAVRGALQFTVSAGADVSCARISTYWVGVSGTLYRSDLAPNGGLVQVGIDRVFVPAAFLPGHVTATGIMNLQVAFRMSEQAFRVMGLPVPPNPADRFLFGPAGSPLTAFLNTNPELWFEVRGVRLSLLVGNQVAAQRGRTGSGNPGMREDGDPGNRLHALNGEWTTFAEVATSLQFFDQATTDQVIAEPY